MIFPKKREELSSSCQASRGAARRPKHLDYTMDSLKVILANAAVFAVWCSSFRISHSPETLYYPTGSIHEALELSPVLLGGAADSAGPTQPARTAKLMRRRICALMGNTFPAKAPNFVFSSLTFRMCPALSRFPAHTPLQTKGSSERSSLSAGPQPGPARGRCGIPPPSEPACPGAPPAAEPPQTCRSSLVKYRKVTATHTDCSSTAATSTAPQVCAGLGPPAGSILGLAGPGWGLRGLRGLRAAVPQRMQPRAQPARRAMERAGRREGP